jgi:hypothetical protein
MAPQQSHAAHLGIPQIAQSLYLQAEVAISCARKSM